MKRVSLKLAMAALIALCILSNASCAKPIERKEKAAEEAHSAENMIETVLPTENKAENEEIFEKNIVYPSRGVNVPATICVPKGEVGCPLVIFAHGFGGSRYKRGGFAFIADALLEEGAASIRMDFAGCGDSSEDFSACSMESMKQDVAAAAAYMESNYKTAHDRIILVGYSMGGRVALEAVADGILEPYAMLLIAPAASTNDFKRLLGGESLWNTLKREAERNGSVNFSMLGLNIGKKLMEELDEIESPTEGAAANFHGKAVVVYSLDDPIVLASVSERTASVLACEKLVLNGAQHYYGLGTSLNSEYLSAIIEKAKELIK